jgi:hypothetical protein
LKYTGLGRRRCVRESREVAESSRDEDPIVPRV